MTTPSKWILHGTDFSECSDEAFQRAIELAKQTGANLEIAYVLESGLDDSPLGFTIHGSNRAGLVAYVDRQLASCADRASKAGVVARTAMLDGSAPVEIVEHARLAGSTLIVVGTHGRTGLAHAFLGSVAERVVQKAICPVLTVPFSRKAA
jgi:nucleotide-binding universal stress UspA family protein